MATLEISDALLKREKYVRIVLKKIQLLDTGIFDIRGPRGDLSFYVYDGGEYREVALQISWVDETAKWYSKGKKISLERVLELCPPELRVRLLCHLDLLT